MYSLFFIWRSVFGFLNILELLWSELRHTDIEDYFGDNPMRDKHYLSESILQAVLKKLEELKGQTQEPINAKRLQLLVEQVQGQICLSCR